VTGFNDAIKTNVLIEKMAGRFTPPNSFNNGTGSAQAFIKVLMSDKFLSIDTSKHMKNRLNHV
ncbi:5197_t:CDS:2, partial [Funneliformis geosporum]